MIISEEVQFETGTGLVLKLRGLKVSDENLLADKKSRKASPEIQLLKSCTIEVLDHGGYGTFSWEDALMGDQMFAFKAIREITYDDTPYGFRTVCPRCEHEEDRKFPVSEIKVKELSPEGRKHVESGDPIVVELPKTKIKVGFRLLRCKDQKKIEKIRKQNGDKVITSLMAFRTVSLEGITRREAGLPAKKDPTGQAQHHPGLMDRIEEYEFPKVFEDLPSKDASFLRSEFEKHDCGLDQESSFECSSCEHEWTQDVEIKPDFLFPKYEGRT